MGAAVMLAAPLAALDIPLKVLVWEDQGTEQVTVGCNFAGVSGRAGTASEGALGAPFDAVESIVQALLGA